MDVKSILQSKTIWFALITSLAGLFGLGETMSHDKELVSDTVTFIVSLIATLGGAGAIWGRWTAKTKLIAPPSVKKFMPVVSLAFVLAAALTLSACQTVQDVFGEEQAQSFEQVTLKATNDALDGWLTVQGLMKVYIARPVCTSDPLLIICKKEKQVVKLKAIDRLVSGELAKLRPLFEARPNDTEVMLAITSIVVNGYNAYNTTMMETD